MQTWRSDAETGLKGDNILPAMYERGKAFGYPFNEVFATIPPGTPVWHNRLRYWPTKPWDSRNGLVTLAGDAAHPMTFRELCSAFFFVSLWGSQFLRVLFTDYALIDRGQGLNNAITDAADFLVHLRAMKQQTPGELAAAVKRYETELWPRGNEAVLASHENTNAVHDVCCLLEFFHSLILKALFLRERCRKLMLISPTTVENNDAEPTLHIWTGEERG